MTINRDRIVFIDLETTGLIPEEGSILEAAAVITDNDLKVLVLQDIHKRLQALGLSNWRNALK